jgi:hypothetical protein
VADKIPTEPALCEVCKKPFKQWRSTTRVCGYRCAAKVPKIERKAEKAKDRASKEAQKTLPTLRKEAQDAFNAFVRARDAGKPCICCGKMPEWLDALTGGSIDSGHYRSRGSCPELAFHEDNAHGQLKACNRFGWDVASYRAELIRRIGIDRVTALEGPHPMPKYSRDDMRAIRDKYRAKAREMLLEAKNS